MRENLKEKVLRNKLEKYEEKNVYIQNKKSSGKKTWIKRTKKGKNEDASVGLPAGAEPLHPAAAAPVAAPAAARARRSRSTKEI